MSGRRQVLNMMMMSFGVMAVVPVIYVLWGAGPCPTAISTALISGALAGRVKFSAWLLFAGLWTTIVYFPLAHMVWGGGILSHAEASVSS